MKNLSNLIKGLQIIAKVEGEEINDFNSQNTYLFIGNIKLYYQVQIDELERLGFYANKEFGCFEFNLD